MRIALDARTLIAPHARGTGRNLIDAYRALATQRPDWEFVLYHQRPLDDAAPVDDPPWRRPNVRLRRIDLPGDRFDAWFQLRLPLAARGDGVDLLHCPANAAPRWRPCACVTTIHDLAPLTAPGEASPPEQAAFRRGLDRAIRGSALLITPSQYTRQALGARFDCPAERVAVVPWAPDASIARAAATAFPASERGRLRAAYDLPPVWLLTFSGDVRRKNAEGVIAALARLPAGRRGDLAVVFVGVASPRRREALQLAAAQAGVGDGCRFLPFVSHAELPGLIRGAAGVLIPSLAEGFGLPVLDAFVCRTPVLAASNTSLPEIAGDAAAYCDPHDPASIAAGIERLLDPTLAADLVARGVARVRPFTWEATATALGAAYARALTIAVGSAPGEVSRP